MLGRGKSISGSIKESVCERGKCIYDADLKFENRLTRKRRRWNNFSN